MVERFGSVFRQTGRNSAYCGGSGYTGHSPLEKKTTSYKGMIAFGQTSANKSAAGQGGIASLFHTGRAQPALPERYRWP